MRDEWGTGVSYTKDETTKYPMYVVQPRLGEPSEIFMLREEGGVGELVKCTQCAKPYSTCECKKYGRSRRLEHVKMLKEKLPLGAVTFIRHFIIVIILEALMLALPIGVLSLVYWGISLAWQWLF